MVARSEHVVVLRDSAAVAALWGDDDDQAADFLDVLRTRALLRQTAQTEDRWTQHPLVRSYARALFHSEDDPIDRKATVVRGSSWYRETAGQPADLLQPMIRRKQAEAIAVAANQSVEEVADELMLGALAWFDEERRDRLCPRIRLRSLIDLILLTIEDIGVCAAEVEADLHDVLPKKY